jgi:PRD1 phage membrane DNA delivery
MNELTTGVVTIATAIVGVAILAVLVSSKSNTAGVLGAAGSAFSNSLSAATGPVTGSTTAPVNSGGGGNIFQLGSLTMPSQMSIP